MKKTREIPAETEDYYSCDYCGNECHKSCIICNKDVCYKCSESDPDDNDSDYPSRICNRCLEIGKPFREKISEIKEKAYEDEEKLMEEWKKEATKNG